MEYIGDIIYDESLLKEDRKLVIFGTGTYGRRTLQYLDRNGLKNKAVCFCVSEPGGADRDVEGIPVISTEDACRRYPDASYLVSGKYAKEMYQIIRKHGIEKIHILFVQ